MDQRNFRVDFNSKGEITYEAGDLNPKELMLILLYATSDVIKNVPAEQQHIPVISFAKEVVRLSELITPDMENGVLDVTEVRSGEIPEMNEGSLRNVLGNPLLAIAVKSVEDVMERLVTSGKLSPENEEAFHEKVDELIEQFFFIDEVGKTAPPETKVLITILVKELISSKMAELRQKWT